MIIPGGKKLIPANNSARDRRIRKRWALHMAKCERCRRFFNMPINGKT